MVGGEGLFFVFGLYRKGGFYLNHKEHKYFSFFSLILPESFV